MAKSTRRTKTVSQAVVVAVLGVDSSYEPLTRVACEYREAHVYPHMQFKGYDIIKFQGPLARRHYVGPEAKNAAVEYITGVGHGSADTFTGDHGDPVFQVGSYQSDEVKGKIIHLLSCQVGRQLGRDFVSNGARAFFGYDENFVFWPAHKEVFFEKRYFSKRGIFRKEVFFECDSEIDRAFAEGLTAAKVYDRVTKLFDKRIAEFRSAGRLREAATLEFDRDHLRCPSSGGARWGDAKAKLS